MTPAPGSSTAPTRVALLGSPNAGKTTIFNHLTGLRARTHLGPPDWNALLGDLARLHAPARGEVVYCGPPGLAVKVRAACARAGMTFRREVF